MRILKFERRENNNANLLIVKKSLLEEAKSHLCITASGSYPEMEEAINNAETAEEAEKVYCRILGEKMVMHGRSGMC
jgi:hypothetical protein